MSPNLYYHDAGIQRCCFHPRLRPREHLHDSGARRLAQAVANDAAFREVYRRPAVSMFRFTR
jgi:hypothetical protein